MHTIFFNYSLLFPFWSPHLTSTDPHPLSQRLFLSVSQWIFRSVRTDHCNCVKYILVLASLFVMLYSQSPQLVSHCKMETSYLLDANSPVSSFSFQSLADTVLVSVSSHYFRKLVWAGWHVSVLVCWSSKLLRGIHMENTLLSPCYCIRQLIHQWTYSSCSYLSYSAMWPSTRSNQDVKCTTTHMWARVYIW